MHLEDMKYAPHTHTNDNDTWQTLAAATARAVLKLEEKKESPDRRNSEGRGTEKQRTEAEEKQHREAVNHGLRQLAQFEARARGERKRSR